MLIPPSCASSVNQHRGFPLLPPRLLALLPLISEAACIKNEPGTLWNYDGTIGNGLRVRMTLVFSGNQIDGLYFYASQLKDIALRGGITDGTAIALDEVDVNGNAMARFEGNFVQRDPRGRFGDTELECETIVGMWHKLGSSKELPVYLTVDSSMVGSLTSRYAPAGAQDDELIHRNALLFKDSVKNKDKKTLAGLIAYPIKVRLFKDFAILHSPAELIANYETVFSTRFREAIANALPRNMFVRDQGIMFANGEVWFGPDGKVIALNNQ